MLAIEELHAWIRRGKRGPLLTDEANVFYDQSVIKQLIPHRNSMLLVDSIDCINIDQRAVRGQRKLRPDDPGFDGHFPDAPIYPGVLLVEAVAQLGLTLLSFLQSGEVIVKDEFSPPQVRATHIHHAAFVSPAHPGDMISLYSQVVSDDYTMIALGQAWVGERLLSYSLCEVLINE